MRIIAAQPADLGPYIDLLEEIAEWLNRRGFGQLPVGTYRRLTDYFSVSIASGEVYLALIENDVVGSLRLLSEDRIVWPEADDDALYLHNLVIRRSWSGRSLGDQLLLWAERRAAIARRDFLRLDCFANNPVLRKYYENRGFEDRGKVDAQFPFGTLCLQRYEKHVLQK